MSDPVTNTEIEDVLTSIRRLVSENRPLTGDEDRQSPAVTVAFDTANAPGDTSEAVSAPAEAPLALVLTPALRVAEDLDEDAEDISSADSVGQGEPVEILDTCEGHKDAFGVSALVTDDTAVSEDHDEAMRVVGTSVDLQEDALAEIQVADGVEHVRSDPAEDVTGDVSWGNDGATESFEGVGEAAPEEVVDEEHPFDFKQVLEARIHQFRDATSTEDVTYAPEANVSPDMADAVMDELRRSMPEDVAEVVDVSGVEVFSEAAEEAAEIDEAMLREMVADIVRQELQGALGERITRNVRKLVRREIHRALAAHDLG